jgi:hypothetical protein
VGSEGYIWEIVKGGCHLIYISSSGQLFNHLQLRTAGGGV